MISIIVACDPNGVIGQDNALPWNFPEDLQHFKNTTSGHPIIMGRRTYESLPRRPLPNRTNIVITRDPKYTTEGAVVTHDIDDAIRTGLKIDSEVYIIGGEMIYRETLSKVDQIILTKIHQPYEGNRFFRYDEREWVASEILHSDEKFSIMRFTRKYALT